jgi:SnoaL-like domain
LLTSCRARPAATGRRKGITVADRSTTVDERLARLEDERAVLDTLYRYGHAIDAGRHDDWVDCFTEDGVWDVRPGPATGDGVRRLFLRGRDELAAFIPTHTHAPGAWHQHLLAEPQLALRGDRCDAESYFARIDGHPAGCYVRAFGRYVDTLVRCPDGRWRIAERIAEIAASHPQSAVAAEAGIEHFAMESIRQLKARYCRLLDTKRWDEWGELFTVDAHLQYGPDDSDVVDGRAAIVRHVSSVLDGAVTVHQVTMPEIEVLGAGQARATWAMFDYTESARGYTDQLASGEVAARDGGEATSFAKQGWGHYEERYERGADGRWRIRWLRLTRLRVDRV